MTRNTIAVVVVLGLMVGTPVAQAKSTGQVNFFLGQKMLDGGDWDPVEDQGEFGVVMSFGQPDWPVHVAVDLLGSSDEGEIFDPLVGEIDVTGSTFELGVGVRKIWSKEGVHPYVGGGLALVHAKIERDSSFGDLDAGGDAFVEEVEAGGLHVGLLLGFGW